MFDPAREYKNRQELNKILMTYAIYESSKAIKIVEDMNNEKTSTLDYVLALADGLRFGNWPWTNYSTPKTKDFRGVE